MKKSIFVAIAFIAATSITNQMFAQEAAKTSGYDLKKNVKCRISNTESGCSVVFDYDVKSPKDVATGQSSGKRQYQPLLVRKEFSVSSVDNNVVEVSSPRDAASGMPSGKRTHKPFTVSSSANSGTSSDATAINGSGGGAGKVNVQDLSVSKASFKEFTVTKRCGGKTTKISCDSGDCEIPTNDCPNGDCAVTVDWSWGASQSGSSSKCAVDFLLEIEDGACTAMAINEKGLPGEKKPNKTKTNNPK